MHGHTLQKGIFVKKRSSVDHIQIHYFIVIIYTVTINKVTM